MAVDSRFCIAEQSYVLLGVQNRILTRSATNNADRLRQGKPGASQSERALALRIGNRDELARSMMQLLGESSLDKTLAWTNHASLLHCIPCQRGDGKTGGYYAETECGKQTPSVS